MDDEKPMDLRDKLAIEIFNGLLSNNASNELISDIIHKINYESDLGNQEQVRAWAVIRITRAVRACYKIADIMRKVRLSAFE